MRYHDQDWDGGSEGYGTLRITGERRKIMVEKTPWKTIPQSLSKTGKGECRSKFLVILPGAKQKKPGLRLKEGQKTRRKPRSKRPKWKTLIGKKATRAQGEWKRERSNYFL